jgi:hypothetical protein
MVEDDFAEERFDSTNGVVYIVVDRVSIGLDIEDFEDFYAQILNLREMLMSNPAVELGVYEEDGLVKRQFVMKNNVDSDFS